MNEQLQPSERLVKFLEGFERFVPYPYDDKVPARGCKYPEWKGGKLKGTATIGFGHTNSGRHPLKVVPGLRITLEKAREIFEADLSEAVEAVKRYVKVPLTQGQFDALVSFTFNCGAGALRKLIAPLNRHDYAGTRAKFDLYIRSGGEVMRGLQRRRDGEQALWDDDHGSKRLRPDIEAVENAPEKVDKPKGKITVKGVVTGVAVGAPSVAAVKEVAQSVQEVAEPVRTAAESVTGALSFLPSTVVVVAVAVAVVAVAGVLLWPKLRDRLA